MVAKHKYDLTTKADILKISDHFSLIRHIIQAITSTGGDKSLSGSLIYWPISFNLSAALSLASWLTLGFLVVLSEYVRLLKDGDRDEKV